MVIYKNQAEQLVQKKLYDVKFVLISTSSFIFLLYHFAHGFARV